MFCIDNEALYDNLILRNYFEHQPATRAPVGFQTQKLTSCSRYNIQTWYKHSWNSNKEFSWKRFRGSRFRSIQNWFLGLLGKVSGQENRCVARYLLQNAETDHPDLRRPQPPGGRGQPTALRTRTGYFYKFVFWWIQIWTVCRVNCSLSWSISWDRMKQTQLTIAHFYRFVGIVFGKFQLFMLAFWAFRKGILKQLKNRMQQSSGKWAESPAASDSPVSSTPTSVQHHLPLPAINRTSKEPNQLPFRLSCGKVSQNIEFENEISEICYTSLCCKLAVNMIPFPRLHFFMTGSARCLFFAHK